MKKALWLNVMMVALLAAACSSAKTAETNAPVATKEIQVESGEAMIAPTYTPYPTYTLYPTHTPLPTDTPTSADVPTPAETAAVEATAGVIATGTVTPQEPTAEPPAPTATVTPTASPAPPEVPPEGPAPTMPVSQASAGQTVELTRIEDTDPGPPFTILVSAIRIVDDDPKIVRLLRASLEQAGYQVFVTYDGETALHVLRRERPDLVVLDLMLPDRDGWDVTCVMRSDAILADTPIIMLTARVEHHDRIVGLELGADDYVTKPFHPGELMARVRAVLRRAQGGPVASNVIRAGDLLIDADAHRVEVRGQAGLPSQPLHLTPTEFGLLQALAERRGHALTRSEMIEQGLGYSYEGLERTVDSHIRNLRRKLDEAGAPADIVETVFGVGYRLAGGGDS